MKKIILSVLFALAMLPLPAQRLARGEKAPELQVGEWISENQPSRGGAMMVEFFHSGNPTSVGRIGQLDIIARDSAGKLSVVVVTREDSPAVKGMLGYKAFFSAIDDNGKTFSAFSALYVPYAVIVDRKGRVAWLGNPSTLTDDDIADLIK